MTGGDLPVALHTLATVAMAGLIWFVQVVHYPLFSRVGATEFRGYVPAHTRRTTWVVAPLMLTEVVTATWLVFAPPAHHLAWATIAGLLLLFVIWLSTAALQVPCHRKLERGLDAAVLRQLVATNWVRTLAWTARAPLAIYLMFEVR